MHNLIEYNKNYLQTSESLWLYYRDKPALDNNDNVIDFPVKDGIRLSFKHKQNIIGRTGIDGTKNPEMGITKISE